MQKEIVSSSQKVETEFEWLLHTLWNKNTKTTPTLNFIVPPTISFK